MRPEGHLLLCFEQLLRAQFGAGVLTSHGMT